MTVISLTERKPMDDFIPGNGSNAVFHLPVAPQTVARTRFSPPPPPRSQCLTVPEALELLGHSLDNRRDNISTVAITGPGDPLATPDITLHTIAQIHKQYPELKIGLRTIGIGAKQLASDLAQAGADFIVITVNGVRAEILEKLYAWIRPGQKTLKLANAVDLLIKEQQNGVPALKFHDLTVQIQTTVYPGHNADHVSKISCEMLELGADSLALLPYQGGPEVEVELESPSCELMSEITAKAANHMKISQPLIPPMKQGMDKGPQGGPTPPLPKPVAGKPNVAVASSNGIEVDLHLGHAIKFLIYGPREDGLACLLETREAPEPGGGKQRWEKVADVLDDCFVLLVASAGETPRRILADSNLKIVITEDNIEGTVDVLFGGGKKGKKN